MNSRKTNIVSLGGGTPVVMLHSAMSSKIQWFRLMHKLRGDFLTIAVDFHGYGDSPMPESPGDFSLNTEIDLVKSLVEEIIPPGTRFHLVGHSFGGAAALRWGLREPKLIKSISVFEPVAFHLLPKNETAWQNVLDVVNKMGQLLGQDKKAEASKFFVDHWNGAGAYDSLPEEARVYFNKTVKKLPLDSRALMEEPVTLDDYSRLHIPVCLIYGKQSPIEARRIVELLDETLPVSNLHPVDSNHMAPVSDPEKVNGLIESFIRRVA